MEEGIRRVLKIVEEKGKERKEDRREWWDVECRDKKRNSERN